MATEVRRARSDELGGLAQFVARLQQGPEACTAYLGASADEIAAEIEGWGRSWFEQCLVAERGAEVVGFIGVDVDRELERVWLYGPCALPADWDSVAEVLLERVIGDVVAGEARDLELAADVANVRLHELALRHGFRRGTPSFLLEIGKDAVDRLPPVDVPELNAGEHGAFAALHDRLFPTTYYSGRQLVEQHERGEAIAVALVEDALTGYAVGRIDTAKEGYVDFLGVAESARGSGRGRRLVTAICRRLVAAGARSKVSLTVYEDNPPALALYEHLGFRRAASLVGYRRRPGDEARS